MNDRRTAARSEAEAMLRIADVIAQELPALTNPQWRAALLNLQVCLGDAVGRRERPGLSLIRSQPG